MTRAAHRTCFALRLLRVLVLVLAGAFGAPKPQFVRHEDPIAAVAEDDAT